MAAAFLVQLGRNAQGDDPKALESALVGKPVPQKTLTDLLENKTYGNEIFQQGKPILLNVWATWCPTCYAEHQYLNQLAKQGVTIIGVDYKDESPKAVKWLKDLGKMCIRDRLSSVIAFFSLWQFYKSKANINPIHLEKSDVFVANGI